MSNMLTEQECIDIRPMLPFMGEVALQSRLGRALDTIDTLRAEVALLRRAIIARAVLDKALDEVGNA